MIDSIKIAVSTRAFTESNLTHKRKSVDEDGVIQYQRGQLKNLRVTVNPQTDGQYEIIIEGSLRKFLLGECAADDLTYTQYLNAIDQVRADLGIREYDMNIARLYRLDLGLTMIMEKEVSTYLRAIHGSSRIKMDYFEDETVQFHAANKKVLFYDKYKEIKRKGLRSQITINGKTSPARNLLRFEVQWLKPSGLGQQLGGLEYLGQVQTKIMTILSRFITDFNSVKFSTLEQVELTQQLQLTSDVLATALIISANGDSGALSIIRTLRDQRLINPAQLVAVRNKIKSNAKRMSIGQESVKDKLLEEIESKIKEKFYMYKYKK